jgi:hypothetical protein
VKFKKLFVSMLFSLKTTCILLFGLAPAIISQPALGDQQVPLTPVGTWSLSLDAGSFNPVFAGLALTGVATFHRDKTLTIVDAGDNGSLGTLDVPQMGVWRRDGNGLRARALIISMNPATGEPLLWQRTTFDLQPLAGSDHMTGVLNVEILPCASSPPVPGALLCPDPVLESDAFVPSGPADVPVEFRRLTVD